MAQFEQLLVELAPKYKKDHKCASDEEAVQAMKEAIKTRGPSTAGTTVSKRRYWGRGLKVVFHPDCS